jgi:hypothetical protein
MDKLTLGAALFIIGIGVLIESLFADGIGIGNNSIFGQYQIIGTFAGGAFTATGLFLMFKAW